MGTFEQVSTHHLAPGFAEMKLKNGTVCNAVWNWQFNGPWKERRGETLAFEKPFKQTFAVSGPRARLVEQQLQATAAPVWLARNLSECFTSVFHSAPPPPHHGGVCAHINGLREEDKLCSYSWVELCSECVNDFQAVSL